MKIRAQALGITVIAVLFGGILFSMAFGFWNTEAKKVPVVYETGEFRGSYNPGDIRGSYTFGDVAKIFPVSVEVLAEAFGVSDREDPGAFRLKELETLYARTEGGAEIGTDSVRLFVARYAGLPYTPEVSTGLPSAAVQLLYGRVTDEEYENLSKLSAGY